MTSTRKTGKTTTHGGRTIERRTYAFDWREAVKGSNGLQRWATAVAYNVVDDYGSMWSPGCFNAALDERMPTLLYGHDWHTLEHVLGKGIDYRDHAEGVDVLIEFDDPAHVPMAGQAAHQVEVKTLRDVSVGFERFEWRRDGALTDAERKLGADEVIVQAGMDELSLVIRGAVPGAQMRSGAGLVGIDAVVEIARRKAAGELSDVEAAEAVKLLGATGDEGGESASSDGSEGGDEGGGDEGGAPDELPAGLMEDLDAALSLVDRSR